jgi:hypothetical protein
VFAFGVYDQGACGLRTEQAVPNGRECMFNRPPK